MEMRKFLQIPGPTNVPDRVLRSLSKPLINHRGPEFEELISSCTKRLKKVFRTDNDVLIFPSSGSGILESVIVNLFSPGDTVAAVSLGVFSERVALIAEKYGVNVIRISKEWGRAVTPMDIKRALDNDTGRVIKALFLPHNETSTGVTNDIEGIAGAVKESGHPALLIVDAVSSLASTRMEMDLWGVDVAAAASQKGLMLPPGMGIAALGERAWKLAEESKLPKWYWDYKAVRSRMADGQFPYTPATTLLFGMEEALSILEEEGLENVWERHNLMAKAVRNGTKAMGLALLPEEQDCSNTVTAVLMPENISYKDLEKLLRTRYGVVIGGGLQKLQGKIFRVGHLGAIYHMDIYAVMGALEMALYQLGYDVQLGTAARAVAETFIDCR